MGLYINPTNTTKEQYLEEHGTRLNNMSPADVWSARETDQLPVVLVDNGPFTAAGVAYSEEELGYFLDPSDPRPKIVYMMSIEDVARGSDRIALMSYLRSARTHYTGLED